ncbi:MAG: hypothetical protein ACYSX0_09360 [Planctomycetota bacterium]|jgi:hypothetical protein
MPWRKLLAYFTGTVDQEILLRDEYVAAENRILRSKIQNWLLLTGAEAMLRPGGSAETDFPRSSAWGTRTSPGACPATQLLRKFQHSMDYMD